MTATVTSPAVAVQVAKKQEPNLIEQVISVIEGLDLKVLESSASIEDIDLRRNEIAKHLIEVATKKSLLKGIKSVSTMREKVYDTLAVKTASSRKMYLALGMKITVIDNLKNKNKLIEITKWRIKA